MKSIHWLVCISNDNFADLSNSNFASYRLRSAIFLSKLFNNYKVSYGENIDNVDSIDYLFVGKIYSNRSDLIGKWIDLIKIFRKKNKKIFFDYTDNHLNLRTLAGDFYRSILTKDDIITTSSSSLKNLLKKSFKNTIVIEDPLDIDVQKIHKNDNSQFLFYGHQTNIPYLLKLIPKWNKNKKYTLYIQSSHEGLLFIQKNSRYVNKPTNLDIKLEIWSVNKMMERAKNVSGIIIPGDTNDPRKSGVSHNRLITAFALGVPVAATRYNSYLEFDHFFSNIDDIVEFNSFLISPTIYSNQVKMAQKKIKAYTKESIALKWLDLINKNNA